MKRTLFFFGLLTLLLCGFGCAKRPRIEGKVSQEDVRGITAATRAAARHKHDEIRTIKVIQSSPLTVRVHTASPHNVTEGDYTLRKIGGDWEVSVESEIIH